MPKRLCRNAQHTHGPKRSVTARPSVCLSIRPFVLLKSIVCSFIYSFVHLIFIFVRSFDNFLVRSFVWFFLPFVFFVNACMRSLARYCRFFRLSFNISVLLSVIICSFVGLLLFFICCLSRLFFCLLVRKSDHSFVQSVGQSVSWSGELANQIVGQSVSRSVGKSESEMSVRF